MPHQDLKTLEYPLSKRLKIPVSFTIATRLEEKYCINFLFHLNFDHPQ